MNYIKLDTLEYPLHQEIIRLQNPEFYANLNVHIIRDEYLQHLQERMDYFNEHGVEHPDPVMSDDEMYPEFIFPDNYALVEEVEFPIIDPEKQYFVELFPINVDGVWKRNFEVRNLTDEDIKQRQYDKKYIELLEEGLHPLEIMKIMENLYDNNSNTITIIA